ncbi:3-deoxy-D-arabinoheptulosonate-7-phosphate synthase [Flexibacter flexilis DSM 6793]|uniref:chorismate mutase n=1 Tax=Flexibacter flexilis DSM 6793 TaxID=927664 RepID=A0A1I1H343_9BACT|nr:chorismate mutase [Flexibacter flexilis]SFC18191.1 3-deoxy-D-arabinoheptulosonate-7-phosphate synthase [Flexibacter flexilis DSM 6793]
MNNSNVSWLGKNTPYIIAGPCSAETEEQVLQTAHELAKDPRITAFRAGIWKPRTRPNNFEGHGTMALPWLQRVKAETGLPVCTEVANAAHVEDCLKHGVDILWIGARTTVNPFSVQEIADALRGTDIPVMVKNPVTPDLQLWLGAIERLHNVGLTKIAAIHRGFSSLEKTAYRNAPLWSLAIDFRVQMPEIPMICDPSHIAGKANLLSEVSQMALDLDMAGLMIETHPNPPAAWSDAAQQVTPHVLLTELLAGLTVKQSNSDDIDFVIKMEQLRQRIDHIDKSLLQLLADRMEVAREIGVSKHDHRVTLLQLRRWADLLDKRLEQAKALQLSDKLIEQLYNLIHQEAILTQKDAALSQKDKAKSL